MTRADVHKLLSKLDFGELQLFIQSHYENVYSKVAHDSRPVEWRLKLVDFIFKVDKVDAFLAHFETEHPDYFQAWMDKHQPAQPADEDTGPAVVEEEIVTTCDVLVLAANPRDTRRLQFEEEAARIRRLLAEGSEGKALVVKEVFSIRTDELQQTLRQSEPRIVHFIGHGAADGNIFLEGDKGIRKPVDPEVLAAGFQLNNKRIECVVLNACYTLPAATALSDHIKYVIGMKRAIGDKSAILFTKGFYLGWAGGETVEKSFQIGITEAKLDRSSYADAPQLIVSDTLGVAEPERIGEEPEIERGEESLQIDEGPTPYPLWFGTNRKPKDANDPSKGFTGDRDNSIHYGICQVSIPDSHKIGSTGSPFWKRLLQRLFTGTDDQVRPDMKSLKIFSDWTFWEHIRETFTRLDPDERQAIVFIHGYNVTFEEAAARAAQIGFDLGFGPDPKMGVQGIMAFFSWPSKGRTVLNNLLPFAYNNDEATIEASVRHITEFLSRFAQESEIQRLHLIAHSMGNRGLLYALRRIVLEAQAAAPISFGQIFLAAPDVDADVMRDMEVVFRRMAMQKTIERATMYVSSKDLALKSSGLVHDRVRAGFAPPITVVEGIDTIEVSHIDLTRLGHGYIAEARPILTDIHGLILNNTGPEKGRALIKPKQTETGRTYWFFPE